MLSSTAEIGQKPPFPIVTDIMHTYSMTLKKLIVTAILFSFNLSHATPQLDYLSQLDKRYPDEKGKKGGPNFFDIPVVRQSLAVAVPRDWRSAMKDELTVMNPNKLVDGYLVVSGCKPHFCPDKYYVASIRVSDGAALFIVFDNEFGEIKNPKSRCFSVAFTDITKLPESVRSELEERDGITSVDHRSLTCAPSGK